MEPCLLLMGYWPHPRVYAAWPTHAPVVQERPMTWREQMRIKRKAAIQRVTDEIRAIRARGAEEMTACNQR